MARNKYAGLLWWDPGCAGYATRPILAMEPGRLWGAHEDSAKKAGLRTVSAVTFFYVSNLTRNLQQSYCHVEARPMVCLAALGDLLDGEILNQRKVPLGSVSLSCRNKIKGRWGKGASVSY